MKILKTKNRMLVVSTNEDGTLSITENGSPIKNAGVFIKTIGGIDAVLAKCQDKTEEEYLQELQSRLEQRKATQTNLLRKLREEYARTEEAYNKIFSGNEVVETTPYNLYVLLSYLNTQNWGTWRLPKMTIHYKCNQYDCDGQQATTITLESPIIYQGEMLSKFQVGAPIGHLIHYTQLFF